jgi:hypothetical protein
MTNIYTHLIETTSTIQITLLRDVNKLIKTDKTGKFKFQYITCFEINKIRDFILNLDNRFIYTVIPVLSIYGKAEDPHIILSKQILITAYSNPELIREYLISQFDKAILDFEFNLDKFHYLKLKRLILLLKII